MIVKILVPVHCESVKGLSCTCNKLFIFWLSDILDHYIQLLGLFSHYTTLYRQIVCRLKQCRTWLCFCFVEFVLNPTGKSYVCILHEYAQHTLRVQPRYVFKELGKIKHANSLNSCMYICCTNYRYI